MERKPKRLRDFGYHNTPEYVWETAPLVQYGVLPREGGWDAQDPLWKEDYYTWSALQARALWEAKPKTGTGSGDEDPVNELFKGDGGGDWKSFVGE